MAYGSGLKRLARGGQPTPMNVEDLIPESSGPPPPPERFTFFTRRPRGEMMPVLGTVDDPKVVRAMALSGGGWLNRNGTAISNGTLGPHAALKTVPEVIRIIQRVDAHNVANQAAKEEEFKNTRREFLSEGGTREGFRRYAMGADLVETIGCKYSNLSLHKELAKAGWFPIVLRRDNGVKEVHCDSIVTEGDAVIGHLRTLADSLKCDVTLRMVFPRPASPDGSSNYVSGKPATWMRYPVGLPQGVEIGTGNHLPERMDAPVPTDDTTDTYIQEADADSMEVPTFRH